MRAALWAVLFLTVSPARGEQGRGFDWADLPSYTGRSTNELIREKSFKTFLRERLPAKKIQTSDWSKKRKSERRLCDYAIELLHGPPDPISLSDGRYYVLRACRAHSCDEKGLLILDAEERRIVSVSTWFFPDGKYSRVPSILIAADRGIDGDEAAAALLARVAPIVGRWIDDNGLALTGFLIMTADGEFVFRSNNAVDSNANKPRVGR